MSIGGEGLAHVHITVWMQEFHEKLPSKTQVKRDALQRKGGKKK